MFYYLSLSSFPLSCTCLNKVKHLEQKGLQINEMDLSFATFSIEEEWLHCWAFTNHIYMHSIIRWLLDITVQMVTQPSLVILFPGKDILAVTSYGMLLFMYCLSFLGWKYSSQTRRNIWYDKLCSYGSLQPLAINKRGGQHLLYQNIRLWNTK